MLELSNVINISVSLAPEGISVFNVNNIALFTSEAFLSNPDSDVYRVYVSPSAVAIDFGIESEAYAQAIAVFSQQPNILAGGGVMVIIPLLSNETLSAAITRTKDLVSYCGIISNSYPASGNMKALADVVQALGNKILFLPSNNTSDIAGAFTDIKNASDSATRCLLYTVSALEARLMAAAYAGRALSVDHAGSNTASTMNLKQLVTVIPDVGVTQTIYAQAQTAGVDVYVSYEGYPAVHCSGENRYFDEVYDLIWLVSQLRANGFNALAEVGTKVPQTEAGISVLKSAYRQALEMALASGYIAPGQWNSAEFFGNQEDMISNILQRGYYIYSQPVNQQSQADREARKSPMIRIAIKEAGSVQSSNVLVSINP